MNNFYVATGIDSSTSSVTATTPNTSNSPPSGGTLTHSQPGGGRSQSLSPNYGNNTGMIGLKGRGISPTRPHPERMPDGPPLSRTLDPMGDSLVINSYRVCFFYIIYQTECSIK